MIIGITQIIELYRHKLVYRIYSNKCSACLCGGAIQESQNALLEQNLDKKKLILWPKAIFSDIWPLFFFFFLY